MGDLRQVGVLQLLGGQLKQRSAIVGACARLSTTARLRWEGGSDQHGRDFLAPTTIALASGTVAPSAARRRSRHHRSRFSFTVNFRESEVQPAALLQLRRVAQFSYVAVRLSHRMRH